MKSTLPLLLSAGLAGCAATLTSKDVPWTPQSAKGVDIGVTAAGVDVSQAQNTSHYSGYRNDFYSTLIAESSGTVAPFAAQPLRLFAALKFKPASEPPSALFATVTMVLPPLGFVPESNQETYSVEFLLRSRDGSVVYRKTLADTVGGNLQGWYIARIFAQNQLKDAEAQSAAKNAARLVLKDLAERADALREAAGTVAGPPPGEGSPAAEPASGGKPWWEKP